MALPACEQTQNRKYGPPLPCPADMCNLLVKSRQNIGKGAKFGTNEADIMQINNRIGCIVKPSIHIFGRISICPFPIITFDRAGKSC